jgi:hypothetical protein
MSELRGFSLIMYTHRTRGLGQTSEGRDGAVLTGMQLYTRHSPSRKYFGNRNHNCGGCPIWYQHKRRRWSAGTNRWDEAMRQATAEIAKVPKGGKDTTHGSSGKHF